MHQLKIISILLISTSLFYIGCSETLTPPIEEVSIKIEFPIGKKAIYATGVYEGDSVDSLQPLGINIFSLQFDTIKTINGGIEYIGNVESYYPLIVENDSTEFIPAPGYNSGRIVVSIDDKWVLFQQSDIMGAGQIFMKRTSTLTDTTLFPTLINNQFPVSPKRISPNTKYSVYRPGHDTSNFASVQRDFDVKNYVEWNDIYGSNEGLFYKTKHSIFNGAWEFDLNGIIDSKGVVISSFAFEFIYTSSESPERSDTVMTHSINRRIVDFTEPEDVKELSWYVDYVLENGLTILEEK